MHRGKRDEPCTLNCVRSESYQDMVGICTVRNPTVVLRLNALLHRTSSSFGALDSVDRQLSWLENRYLLARVQVCWVPWWAWAVVL